MTTPALLRLREALPGTRLTLLTPAKLADLYRAHPAVDSVLPVAADETLPQVARRVRGLDCRAGLVLPNSTRSALELWLGRVPRRIGYAGSIRRALLTEVVPRPAGFVRMRKRPVAEVRRLSQHAAAAALVPPPEPLPASPGHHLHHYLHLAAWLGADPTPCAPKVVVQPPETDAVRSRFGLDPSVHWLGLNPGAEYGPAKRWPLERFAAVGCEVARWPGWGILLLGGKSDVPLAEEVETRIRHGVSAVPASGIQLRNLAGQTSLRELAAVLGVCRTVLTNDTGPMHLAAAVGTPVVVLFGSTAPELTAPGLPGDGRHRFLRADVPCAPCFLRECPIDLRCLKGIEVVRVLDAVREVAGEPPGHQGPTLGP